MKLTNNEFKDKMIRLGNRILSDDYALDIIVNDHQTHIKLISKNHTKAKTVSTQGYNFGNFWKSLIISTVKELKAAILTLN
jgi:hypothetical protein